MENSEENNGGEGSRRLVVAITDFLREQLLARTELVPEDRDCLEIAIQCLEMAYGLEADGYVQYRFARPLLDVFNQVTNPVSIRDKLQAETHKEDGNAFMLRNDYSNAETEYSQAIELDRWNAIYYCNRASARIEQQHFFEAISDCRQALMLNPDYAKAHARMGQAYALIHRPRDAARCFRQALQLEPDNERYRNNVRVAESEIDRPDAGTLLVNLLSSIFGALPNVPNNRGSAITLPNSFMIITESHPPIRQDPPDRAQVVENSQSAESIEERPRDGSDSSTEAYNIVYPPLFGVIDEGSEEESVTLERPTGNDRISERDGEIVISIHGMDLFPASSIPNSRIETGESRAKTAKQENDSEDRAEGEATQPGEVRSDSAIAKVPPLQNIATDGASQCAERTAKQEIDSKIKSERGSAKPGVVSEDPVTEKGGSIQKASNGNQTTDDEIVPRSEEKITSHIVKESESIDSVMHFDDLQKLKGKYSTDTKTATSGGRDREESIEQEAGSSGFQGAPATEWTIDTDVSAQRSENENQEVIDCKIEYRSPKEEVTVSGADTKTVTTTDPSTNSKDRTDKQ